MVHKQRLRKTRDAGGFTLVEVIVSSLIAAMIFGSVAALQYIAAQATYEMYGQTHTRSSRMRALDQIRFKLSNAAIATIEYSLPATYGTGYNRIDFQDPNLRDPDTGITPVSAYMFNPSTTELYYDEDTSDDYMGRALVTGPIDISFEPSDEAAALIILNVKSSSDMAYADVDIQDGETKIYARN